MTPSPSPAALRRSWHASVDSCDAPVRRGRRARRLSSRFGDLALDVDSHEVRRGSVGIALTATEFGLLRLLMRDARPVLSKTPLLDRVRDNDFGGQGNVVAPYLSYLRKEIDAGRSSTRSARPCT